MPIDLYSIGIVAESRFPTYKEAKAEMIEAWNRRTESEELQFTRKFIHEHGLEFALASAWERRKKDGIRKEG